MSNIFRDEPASGQLRSSHLVNLRKDANTEGAEKNIYKRLRKLTPRTYLGLGYVHKFRHDVSGEIVYVPCPQAEYESMLGVGGSANNPTFSGHTWVGSSGGTYKFDTLNDQLGDDEYADIGGGQLLVNFPSTVTRKRTQYVTSADILEEKIDEDVWK